MNHASPVGDPRGGASRPRDLQWLEVGARPLDWNGPTGRPFISFRDEDLERSVVDGFERLARQHGNRVALTDSNGSLSYAALSAGMSGLAEQIAAETALGDLIAILLPSSSMFPVAVLACLAAGRPFLALDPQSPRDWLNEVLADARPSLIIGDHDGLGASGTTAPARRLIELTRLPGPAGTGWRPAPFDPDAPACVLFTSGSTGRPKGIVNSQRNLLQRVAQSINAAHINSEDRLLTLAPHGTIVGVRDTLTALLAGAGIHLLDPQRAGARQILNVIHGQGVTILFAFPALLRAVIPSGGERAGAALRIVRVGGDTMLWTDIDLLRGWLAPGTPIQLIYAATEAPMMQWFVDDSLRTDDPRIPIGYPLRGNRLAIVGADGRNTPQGEVGELIVESPYVALGRWTGGRCVMTRLEDAGALRCRLFRTGDLVRQRTDGLLERIGRKDRQVKIRGVRVDVEGVEAILRRHPLVSDAAVLARAAGASSGADSDVTLVAYVSARDDAPGGLFPELREYMRSAPPPMRPARLYLLHQIPRLLTSKLDLRALTAIDEANARNEQATAVSAGGSDREGRDPIAQAVAQVWQEVLQMPAGGPDDDFFAAGGDSLKAITFMIRVERALGVELPLTLITEAPTFAGLCDALRKERSYVPLVLLKPGDQLPPLFVIHGLGGSVAGFIPMARRMTYAGPVLGIQARGLDGRQPPHATVEEMAAEYLGAVKVRQPVGPYFLCGYSFGGLVAFEMARRLQAAGDQVALVGLFDTTTSPLRRSLRSWLLLARRRAARFASRLAVPTDHWPPSLRDLLPGAPTNVFRVAASAMIASVRYRPGVYPGELTLFRPLERDAGVPPLEAMWRDHARTLSVVETAGTHATMFSATHAASTAASLTRCLPRSAWEISSRGDSAVLSAAEFGQDRRIRAFPAGPA